MKKFTAILLSSLMLVSAFSVGASASKPTTLSSAAAAADVKGAKNYTIENPYKDVKWGEWREYKASLHSHTNASDAEPSMVESIE